MVSRKSRSSGDAMRGQQASGTAAAKGRRLIAPDGSSVSPGYAVRERPLRECRTLLGRSTSDQANHGQAALGLDFLQAPTPTVRNVSHLLHPALSPRCVHDGEIFLASNTFPTPLPASAHACTLTTASGARDGAPSPRATRRRCNHVLRRSPVFSSFVRGPIRAAAWSSQTARWSLAASAAARSRRFSLDLASSAASRREAQCLSPAVRGLASRHAVLCTIVVAGPKTRFFCPFRYAIYRNRNSVRKPCITHSRAMSA